MAKEYIEALMRCRAKLVDQRRNLVKRDVSSDRNEGYAERIVAIEAALDATDHAIEDEKKTHAVEYKHDKVHQDHTDETPSG